MPNLLDLAYTAGVVLSAPVWGLRAKSRAKVLSALRERRAVGLPELSPVMRRGPRVLIHAVSLGEINATRTLVAELLARRDDLRVIVTATTAAGYARAQELYGGERRAVVARYPLDFSGAVGRFLDAFRPDAAVLMELELWPNFLRACRTRAIPVVLVNGRLTEHSLRRYRLVAPVARRMFRSLALLCVQDDTYRSRFLQVGADPARTLVTGTMKFDTAALTADPAKTESLRTAMGLAPGEPLWVAGSTGPGEEEIILRIYRQLLQSHPTLRLAIIPRKPERFDEVAALIEREGFGLIRRSRTTTATPRTAGLSTPDGAPDPDAGSTIIPRRISPPDGALASAAPATAQTPVHASSRVPPTGETPTSLAPVLLGDTLGELRHFYALATVVFVGRTLVDLGPAQHGSDMIEPAALGKPVVVGRYTGNFTDAMHLLRTGQAILEVTTEHDLSTQTAHLLTDPTAATALATAAATVVQQGQGATTRHADRILNLLPP